MRLIAVSATQPAESLAGADAIVARLTDLALQVDASEITVRISR